MKETQVRKLKRGFTSNGRVEAPKGFVFATKLKNSQFDRM